MTPQIKSRPLFSILHTSARPDKWREVYDAWMGSCKNPAAVEYVLCIDTRWGFTLEMVPEMKAQMRPQDTICYNVKRRCYVDGVNIAAAASTGMVLIVNADDQYPCLNWDAELIKKVPPSIDFVIRVNTGTPQEVERRIMCMPILSRPRYEMHGYVMFPEYESMYSDNDFCEQAELDRVVVEAQDLLFPHRHPICDRNVKMDAVYDAQNRAEAYISGKQILERRRASNFGKRRVVMEMPSQQAHLNCQREKIAVALPGERFSSTWVYHWTQLFGGLLTQYNVHPNFCYSSNVYATRQTLFDDFSAMRPQPDYMLWIDDDNLVTVDQVQQLILDLKANPEMDMVAGWCWQAGDVYNMAARTSVGVFESSGLPRFLSYEELQARTDVSEIGFTGFPIVLMRRNILDKLGKDAFAPRFGPLYDRGYAGEDVSFCIRAREAGVRILVDRRIKVPHLKLRSAEPKDLPVVEEQTEVA